VSAKVKECICIKRIGALYLHVLVFVELQELDADKGPQMGQILIPRWLMSQPQLLSTMWWIITSIVLYTSYERPALWKSRTMPMGSGAN